MEQVRMKNPPIYPTQKTPEEIIGYGNMSVFVDFLRICYSGTNQGEFPNKRLDKEIGVEDRAAIAGVLRELRENGYHPLYVNDRGKIRWGVDEKSDFQVIFDKEMDELYAKSVKENQDLARRGYLKIVESVSVHNAEPEELNFQEEERW